MFYGKHAARRRFNARSHHLLRNNVPVERNDPGLLECGLDILGRECLEVRLRINSEERRLVDHLPLALPADTNVAPIALEGAENCDVETLIYVGAV